MEASGHSFLRLLCGGNSGSVNLLSRKEGGLPGSSRIPPEGTSEPVSVWEDGKPWPGHNFYFYLYVFLLSIPILNFKS